MVANFKFGSVNRLLVELNIMISVSNHNMKLLAGAKDERYREAVDQCILSIKQNGEIAEKLLSGLKCQHIDSALRALRNLLKADGEFSWSELNTRARALRDAIEIDLGEYYYYQYPRQKSLRLRSWAEDWKESLASFPGIRTEVFHATDCYALGRDTASIFHSMRVAEHGLRALAKERRVKLPKNKPVEWATWQEVIRALDEEIRVIGGKRAGAAKDAALEFYSGARADLNGFKDEYRNLVSHVRATYDELQALRALTTVNAFMERVASKIDHKHSRIRWGLR
jgi:hypothetical protein